ncbi:MAG: hypothetical protein Q9188_000202 [Gyalolechia gomerana]
MSRPLGEPAPPAPPIRCTLYFYTWACGHKEWVHCSNCNLDEPNKYRVCNHPPPLEEQLASLNSPLMLEIRRNLAVVNSCRAVRNARAAEDVDAKENPWRHGFDDIDMTPDDRLTNRILMDNWQTTQHAARLEEWQRGFGTQGQPSGPESESTVRPPSQQAAEESTTPTPGSQQTTPRQPAPRQLATGQAASSQQPGGHGRGQSSASTQQTSEPGLPVPNLIPNHLLALLIPQLAYTHPSNTQWGGVQQGQSQPSGFEPSNVPQQHGGSMVFGSAERGPGYGQLERSDSVRQATSLSLPTPRVGSLPVGGSAKHGGQAQGDDVEQAAEEVEGLRISERGRGGAGQGRGGSGTAGAQRR